MRALLLIVAVGAGCWLIWPETNRVDPGGILVKSARRFHEDSFRRSPGRPGAVEGMAQFAAGLRDEELKRELKVAVEDWVDRQAGRSEFGQPKLAIMLAREMGKRRGEAGMKEVARWLDELEEAVAGGVDADGTRAFEFGEIRTRMAGYAGWVSDRPEEAVSRLIESRRLRESGWPVVNQGTPLRWNGPQAKQRRLMEEVLRDGFRRIATRDLPKAYRLLAEGADEGVFDGNKVLETLIGNLSETARREILMDWNEVSSWPDLAARVKEREGFIEIRTMRDLRIVSEWMPGFSERLREDSGWIPGQIDVFVRTRPGEARRVIEAGVRGRQHRSELLNHLLLEDPENYDLISLVNGPEKIEAVQALVKGSQEDQFGPLTGEEDSGAFDVMLLREALETMTIKDEDRAEIRGILSGWNESR